MAKLFITLSLLLAMTIIGSTALILPENIEIELISTEEMENFLKQYPNATKLQTIEQPQEKDTRDVLKTYYLGSRVAGDSVVGYASAKNSWGTPQNVYVDLTYPANGVGRIVSYVNIVVQQSNSLGEAFVLSGGIGQRSIKIRVTAYSTYVFNYNANIYGY